MDGEMVEAVCSKCGGQLCWLGTLGNMLWLRCRDCGMDFSVTEED